MKFKKPFCTPGALFFHSLGTIPLTIAMELQVRIPPSYVVVIEAVNLSGEAVYEIIGKLTFSNISVPL